MTKLEIARAAGRAVSCIYKARWSKQSVQVAHDYVVDACVLLWRPVLEHQFPRSVQMHCLIRHEKGCHPIIGDETSGLWPYVLPVVDPRATSDPMDHFDFLIHACEGDMASDMRVCGFADRGEIRNTHFPLSCA